MTQKLETPAMKSSIDWKDYFSPDLLVVSSPEIKHLEQIIPYAVLLDATQTLEIKEKERRKESGFSSTHCGNSGDIIRGGSFGHIVEHAIIAVFDSHVPPSEVCAGGITSNYETQDPELGTLSDIRIAFPLSITREEAQIRLQKIQQNILDQYTLFHAVDLSNIQF